MLIWNCVHWRWCPFGMMSIWDDVHSGWYPFGMVYTWDRAHSGWYTFGMVSIRDCVFPIVSIRERVQDRVHSRSCPCGMVFIRDCVHLELCPFGIVSIRHCVHSALCPFEIVFTRDGVHLGLCFSGLRAESYFSCYGSIWLISFFLQKKTTISTKDFNRRGKTSRSFHDRVVFGLRSCKLFKFNLRRL